MKNTKNKIEENLYLPNPHLGTCIKWWQKNGSFNVELYLLICKLRNEKSIL